VFQQPTDVVASNGDEVDFDAEADGTPDPTVQWQRSTTSGGSTFANINTSSNPSAATSDLDLPSVAVSDNGYLYRAVFTNIAGTDTSDAVTLTVTP
jgi:hypothetical protein